MIILGDSASFLVCAMCSMNIAWRCSCVLTALINPSLWHRPDVEVITANPKTAGVARWNFLALWGHRMAKGDTAAEEYVTKARPLQAVILGAAYRRSACAQLTRRSVIACPCSRVGHSRSVSCLIGRPEDTP